MLRQVQSDRSNLAHGWLPFAADSITAVWHSDAARGPSTPSFNHLVGAAEQRQWNRDAERLGGLEVDDQLDFGQLLDRQISELGTRKNPAGIDADLTVQVGDIASVADQAAGRRERAILIDRGYSVAERKCGQLLHLPVEERVGAYDKSAGSHPNQGRKGRIDIAFGACVQHM